MKQRILVVLASLLAPVALYAAPERTPAPGPVTTPAVNGVAPIDTIDDGGFEAGTPNPFWTESSTNFGTPICDLGACGDGTGTGPNSGTFWAWFGGIAAAETGSVSQDIQMTAGGTATVDFFLEIPATSGNGVDFLELRVDGNTEWSVLENEPGFATYAPVSVDISAYADGAVHTFEFFSTITGSPSGTNFFIDDVTLTVEGPAPGIEIPTLGQIGLTTLLLLIAVGGVALLRRT